MKPEELVIGRSYVYTKRPLWDSWIYNRCYYVYLGKGGEDGMCYRFISKYDGWDVAYSNWGEKSLESLKEKDVFTV